MLIHINAAALNGISAIHVTVEIATTPGTQFSLVGLPDSAVKESHERVMTAINSAGWKIPVKKITINLAPAGIKKAGPGYDLPIAVGLLATIGIIPSEALQDTLLFGELGLDGSLRPLPGALPIALMAKQQQFKQLILPQQIAPQAAHVKDIKVIPVESLQQVVRILNGSEDDTDTNTLTNNATPFDSTTNTDNTFDFADVRGQQTAKRALEVAAAGAHNILLIGPPGSGKSMLAKRIPSILPPLTKDEQLQASQIYSAAGLLKNKPLLTQPPFRAPHHSISQAALVGGGPDPKPGEVSLAHRGVLFLDELPEFSRMALESLRQPLEDRQVTITRAAYNITLPCSFMLVASMNPCPCGYYNHPQQKCTCSPGQVRRYLARISGPLLDRFDIQIQIPPVNLDDLTAKDHNAETSQTIRQRVINARQIQNTRFADIPDIHSNAEIYGSHIQQLIQLNDKTQQILHRAIAARNLSARAYHRILRLARTIADLQQSTEITPEHIAEAVSYRTLDNTNWGD